MPAWEITKIWSDTEISDYRKFIAAEAPKRVANLRSTCEDLALRLVIDFAAQNGLPVAFANGANKAGLTPEQFATKDDFVDRVLTTTGASDLLTFNTVKLAPGAMESEPSSLGRASIGDIVVLYTGGGHVQVVTAASPSQVTIAQGTFRPTAERCGLLRRLWNKSNQNRPTDPCYIGEIVRQQRYTLDSKSKTWQYGGSDPDVFRRHGRLSIWDFAAWNNLVEKHTVKPGESLSSIAQRVYGDSRKWTRIYYGNRSVIGNDPDTIKPGQVLFFWK